MNNYKKLVLYTILFFLILKNGYSTGQVPDFLIYKSDTLAIFSNPLEQYFELTGNTELPDFVGCGSTACWRGYCAFWKIENDSLFLIKITSCHDDCGLEIHDANLEKMFGNKFKNNKVFASWSTIRIVAPQGRLVQYVHMGYASIYENELYFNIKSGILTNTTLKSNKQLVRKYDRQNLVEKNLEPILDTIFYYVKNNNNWEKLDAGPLLCDDVYILTINKNGKIVKAVFEPWEDSKFKEFLYNLGSIKCFIKIKHSTKKLRVNYLGLNFKYKINFEILYDPETDQLELWKPIWMDSE